MGLNILCVSPGYYPAFELGGVATSVHAINRVLFSLSNKVTVCATTKYLRGKVVYNRPVEVDRVMVYYFNFSVLWEKIGLRQWMVSKAMVRFLKNNVRKFDIVHINTLWDPPGAIAAHYCRKYGKRYIISPHGMLLPPAAARNGLAKRLYFHCIAKKDLCHAACVHYTSRREAELSNAAWKLDKRYSIIYNGITVSEPTGGPITPLGTDFPETVGKRLVLFLGRIDPIKGIDLLIGAFAQVKKQLKDIHLIIGGEDKNPYADAMKKLVLASGLRYCDRVQRPANSSPVRVRDCEVTFSGQLLGEKKTSIFAASTVLVLMSQSENFGMVAAEAMMAGVPVIVSDGVGIAHEVEDWQAGIVIPRTVAALSEAIKRLLANPAQASAMGRQGKIAALKHFSAQETGKQMAALYEKIAGVSS